MHNHRLFSPVLVLVVPSCSSDAKIACNLSGIEIYEYEKEESRFFNYSKLMTVQDVIEGLKNEGIPLHDERCNEVDAIYDKILETLVDLGCEETWKRWRAPAGEFWHSITHSFVNKWIFQENKISIGIYEYIFEKHCLDKIYIEFYYEIENQNSIEAFVKKFEPLLPKEFTPQGSPHFRNAFVPLVKHRFISSAA